MAKKTAVGIDLGTTYSCVGVYRNGGVDIITTDDGNRSTPSYVSFTDTGCWVGNMARTQAAIPENTVFNVKRLIGRKFTDPLVQADMSVQPFKVEAGPGDRPMICVQAQGEARKFHPEEISSMVLRKMREAAEAHLGATISDAVIGVPASFNDAQRQATKDAGTISGLNVLQLINEPTAAAVAYSLGKKGSGEQHILVCDMGSGTVDVSLLAVEDGIFEVKATAGDAHLGGVDIDDRLLAYCMDDFMRKNPGKEIAGHQRAIRRLRSVCERAKRALKNTQSVTIEVDSLFEGIDYMCELSRATFEELNMDYFSRSLRLLEKCLRDSGLDKQDVHEVLLVGGSTRIPKVQSMIQEFFDGKQLSKSVNPDEAVAIGAAVQAAILTGDSLVQMQDMLLLDVTPLHIGIEAAGGVMTTLIDRNTTIPTTKTQTFTTYTDSAAPIGLLLYEGEHAQTKDNHLLGRFQLNGIPPAPRGVPRIEVAVDIDANGILSVSATCQSNGRRSQIATTSEKGCLTQTEINRLVREAERFRAKEEYHKQRREAKNELEIHCFTARTTLNEGRLKRKIEASDAEEMEKVLQDTLEWLDANQQAEKDEFEAKHLELEATVDAIMMKTQPSSVP